MIKAVCGNIGIALLTP
ncbi:hypothetical protein P3509_23960 [Vibrio parahaemolyticus]|nr:hypothetical protein [Vibrio jasicida]MDF4602586.1 hypothetical protein [Vibrio parahaemolyticus]